MVHGESNWDGGLMSGYVLLEGGAEFGGRMAEADTKALELAGGFDVQVTIIPAAAAPDNNHEHAGQTGVRWFEQLGARHAGCLPLVDHASANQAFIAASLRESRLIYLLGGFPHYLAQTLANSLSWQAMLEAYHAGAVVGGSSAGAMVLCQHYYDPGAGSIIDDAAGLNHPLPSPGISPRTDRKRATPKTQSRGGSIDTSMCSAMLSIRFAVLRRGGSRLVTSCARSCSLSRGGARLRRPSWARRPLRGKTRR